MPSKKINISELWKKFTQSQLIIPITALVVLVIFNLIRDPSFFSIVIKKNNLGNTVLAGNLVSILNGASELVILAIGMTFVTSATRGQDSAARSSTVGRKALRTRHHQTLQRQHPSECSHPRLSASGQGRRRPHRSHRRSHLGASGNEAAS